MRQFNIVVNNSLCELEQALPTSSHSVESRWKNRMLIKKNLFVLLLLLFVSINYFANNPLQLKAEKAYQEKNYKEAITSYEAILKEGLVSYKLYYNLGNAYYKNNQIGKAIYNYELANKLQPNNGDIKTNLKIANEKTIDKIESRENFFIGAIKSGLVNILSTTGWAWFSIATLIITLLLAFLFLITKHLALKRIGFFFGIISFILFISSMFVGFTALEDKKITSFAIITTRESKIYEEPSTTSNSKFNLHDGTKVSVLETNNDWTNIKLENGNEGWIKTKDVSLF